MTNDPDIRIAKSIPDYIFRWMGKRFLDAETQSELGIMSAAVRERLAAGDVRPDAPSARRRTHRPPAPALARPRSSTPGTTRSECAKCGGRKVRTGACYTCRDCGDNSGCG